MKKQRRLLLCPIAAALGMAAMLPLSASAAEGDDAAAIVSAWNTDSDGKIYYYDADGNYAKGEVLIDGQYYLFSENGVLKTGWRTVNGQRCYFDPESGKSVTGWIDYFGQKYYVDPGSGKAAGKFTDSENNTYIADGYGSVITEAGFTQYEDSCIYVNEGGIIQTESTVINGVPYNIEADGTVGIGWQTASGDLYYINSDGSAVTGIADVDGMKYCFDNGKLLYGWQEADGKKYYAGEDGILMTGLFMIDNELYCFDENCVMLTGMQTVNDALYYFNETNGTAASGWKAIGSDMYYFGEDYTAAKELRSIDGKTYYFGTDGVMMTGRYIVNGDKYCFGEDGAAVTGLQTLEDGKYYFNETGIMQLGWQTIDGNRYFFTSKGPATKGWASINSKKYYFNDECIMLTGRQIIDGSKYYIADDGSVQTGFQTLDDGTYYFNADGKMQFGWQTIDGKKYYFYENGKMAVSCRIDGYNLAGDGTAFPMSEVQKRAASIIATIGKTPDAVYNYVRSHNRYKYIEATKTLAQIQSIGWSYFANFAMDNRNIVCYYFAAITDILFQEAGLRSRVVYGTGTGTGDHYWNQVYINGTWTNYDTCNGFANVTDEYLKTYTYTWKQFIYPDFREMS